MRQLLSRNLGIVCWMMMNWMDGGDVNKHAHPDCVVIEDIIIMMEWNKMVGFKITTVVWCEWMNEWWWKREMNDWNKQGWWSGVSHVNVGEWIGVEIPKNVMEERCGWMVWKKEGKKMRKVSCSKASFGRYVSWLLPREWKEWNGLKTGRTREWDVL